VSESPFSLCAKCGNIKPAGVTECEFCKNAKSVSLADLKAGIQNVQQDPVSAPAAAPVSKPETPADRPQNQSPSASEALGLLEEPAAKPSLPPPCAAPHVESPCCAKQPSQEQASTSKPCCGGGTEMESSAEKPGGWAGFVAWLRKLFGM
jgi:hypothetical protein